jgi:hypothetical protein
MKEFLLLFRGGDPPSMQQSPEKFQSHMEKWTRWIGQLSEQGRMLGAQPLTPEGKVVKGIKKTVSDGPFMEGKEMVGGYLLCKAASFEEAVDLSKGCPIFEFDDGVVEVREIQLGM